MRGVEKFYMAEKKTVLITGFLQALAEPLPIARSARLHCFWTSRTPSSIETMSGVEGLPLDVRLDESVNGCVDTVVKRTGR